VVVWWCGGVVVWWCGGVVVWWCGGVVVWCGGVAASSYLVSLAVLDLAERYSFGGYWNDVPVHRNAEIMAMLLKLIAKPQFAHMIRACSLESAARL
jgi:hypothetical protein